MGNRDIGTKSESDVLAREGHPAIDKPISPSPESFELVDLTALNGPRFIITVDTEEEFDWHKPFSREGHGTTHLKAVPRFQSLCSERGIKPCYLIDYPVAEDVFGADLLGGYANTGDAEIGVQLHPWVNPPYDEAVSWHNSYACNLPPALERAKLNVLHAAIVSRLGIRPDAYRAGRYGAGPNTAAILADIGIAIDTSVRSRFDYSAQGGPNYARHPVNPYWIKRNKLLELPLTTVFAGALRRVGNVVFGHWFESQVARSMMARSNMLERIALTPEGIPLEKALKGIDLALQEGVSIINLSLHSPSLAVGHTPYVRDEHQLEGLYRWLDQVFHHLRASGVRSTTMAEIKAASQ
jgi:hypothetical protein